MKRYILSLLFLTGVLFGASAQEKVEKEGCQAYKEGHFIIKENLLGKKYIIKRKGNKQIETDPDGTKFIFDVNWIDDCTYTLSLKNIRNNPNNVEWKEGQIITVSILNTHNTGYTQKSSSNIDGITFVKDMLEIDEKKYKKYVRNSGEEEEAEDLTFNN